MLHTQAPVCNLFWLFDNKIELYLLVYAIEVTTAMQTTIKVLHVKAKVLNVMC